MSIRNRLNITTLISIILIIILIPVIIIISSKISKKNKQYKLAHEIFLVVAELDIITYEYLMYREKRMEEQWNLKYNSIINKIDKEVESSLNKNDFSLFK